MNKSKFWVALFTVIIYELLMAVIHPIGLSLTKVAITLLVWTSFYLSFSTFIEHYFIIKTNMPKYAFIVFISIIVWNIVNIFRSLFGEYGSITTLFGNSETSLALLVPFSLTFSFDKRNLRTINSLFIRILVISIPLYLLYLFSLIFLKAPSNIYYGRAFLILFSCTVFLITVIPFQLDRIKLVIFLGSVLLIYLGFKTGYRVVFVRVLLLYLLLILIYLYKTYNFKYILFVVLFSLLIPLVLLRTSIKTQQSVFENYLSKIKFEEFSDDTRTFLYIEVFDDLVKNNNLLIGKGSNGTYFSPYFNETKQDTSNRLSVEVGILAVLLKGGLIAVFLNLTLLFISIYLSLFRANNYFVMSMGFMLVIHNMLLYITNYLDYSVYNMAIWFFIGACLSKEIRSLTNEEIINILHSSNELS